MSVKNVIRAGSLMQAMFPDEYMWMSGHEDYKEVVLLARGTQHLWDLIKATKELRPEFDEGKLIDHLSTYGPAFPMETISTRSGLMVKMGLFNSNLYFSKLLQVMKDYMLKEVEEE